MYNRYLDILIRRAEESKMIQRHAALVVCGKREVATVCNTPVSHDTGSVYSKHAEENAIDKLKNCVRRGQKINNPRICVIRVRRDGLLANSKPCRVCCEKMQEAGIKKVSYSMDDQQIHTSRVEDILKENYFSSGYRNLLNLRC
jgi:deoxycytidylate deaminase